jgi:hypothetical protein
MAGIAIVIVAPRPMPAGLAALHEDWIALHHELGAWLLTGLLSEQAFDRWVRRLRLGPAA